VQAQQSRPIRARSWRLGSIHAQRPRGQETEGLLPPPRRHGLRRLLLLLHPLHLLLHALPPKYISPVSPYLAASSQAAAARPLGTAGSPIPFLWPTIPAPKRTVADDLVRSFVAGVEMPQIGGAASASGRRHWIVGSEGGGAGSWSRWVQSRAAQAGVRDGGGDAHAAGVAAGACRHGVRGFAAAGRTWGTRGHQYRFCFS
jgi:hypothetical protein